MDIIDFDYFIAHDDIALELKPLLGMLRKDLKMKITVVVFGFRIYFWQLY